MERPLDTTAAEAYEKHIVPAFMLPLVNGVIDNAAPVPGEGILDVACGTGLVARLVAPRVAPGGTVSNLDFDPAMIAVARGLVECPLSVNMTWHCASALSMPFDDGEFDLVFCLNGLQFLPACAAGLAEMRRVMKPGGRLIYATCSLLDAENREQVAAFLAAQPEFSLLPYGEIWRDLNGAPLPSLGDMLQLTPAQHGTDGFFVAVMARKEG